MKDFFKPNDFMQRLDMEYVAKECADIANEKLNKLIQSWPVIYGFYEEGKKAEAFGTRMGQYKASHTAKLAFIEEIKKEPCKHRPILCGTNSFTDIDYYRCEDCGVELVPTWNEKK